MRSLARGTLWPPVAAAIVIGSSGPAAAQTAASEASGASTATAAQPCWIATASTGVLARDGDAARPFGVVALAHCLGRGYVRVAATRFDSVLKQVDAALPSSFTLLSVGGGGTFGQWFVDAAASAGRQSYGDVTTALGTRPNQAGSGSGVYGGSLDGGRFIRLGRRVYLTPSFSLQYNAQRALRSSMTPQGPRAVQTNEQAWTVGATARLDRFFGKGDRHLVGLSVSRVQTTNGAVAITAGGGSAPASVRSIGNGWLVVGAATSLRLAPRLWLDGSATPAIGARSGNYTTASLGARLGF